MGKTKWEIEMGNRNGKYKRKDKWERHNGKVKRKSEAESGVRRACSSRFTLRIKYLKIKVQEKKRETGKTKWKRQK